MGPGDERACPACLAPKRLWKRSEYQLASARPLHDFRTPCRQFLSLFDSPLDIVYDPLHCIAPVISHAVFHALYLWFQENCSAVPSMQQGLLTTFASAKLTKNFREPKGPAISRRESAIGNKDTKALLRNYIFWQRLANLLPTARDGLTVSHPELSAAEIAEPFQCYPRLVQYLARDLISWNPKGVETRDADGRKMHVLFQSLSLRPRRWSVAVLYFTEHNTDRLQRHGNLQGLCSEGGEHLHQPHARLVERCPSKPSWKCPLGLIAIARWGAQALRLWGARVLAPLVACAETPTFPAS